MKPAPRTQSLRLVKQDDLPAANHKDAELLSSVRAGNPQSAVNFHDRVIGVVTRTVARLLGNRDPDYEDVIQQALIELVLAVDRFRGQCPLDAWVSIISARSVYRHLRRRKIERRLFVLESSESMEYPSRSASNGVVLRSLIRRLESQLHAIEAKKAWTFVLHDVHGYDLTEIAEITGASVAAVQSRLVRARKELHSRISASGDLAAQLLEFAGQGAE